MRLHLNNPIAIVICKTIYGKKLSEVRFVSIANRRKGLTQNLKGTIADKNRQNIAEKIAEILGIKFSITTYDKFIEEDIDILDSTLVANNVKGKFDLVLQSSDAYCRLGFQSYFRFFAYKIHLFQYWRKIINYKKVKNLYVFNFHNYKYKFTNIKIININLTRKNLKQISSKLNTNTNVFLQLNTKKKILLVLPPVRNIVGVDFHQKFIGYMLEVAKRENMYVVIKPHRGDYTNYSKLQTAQLDLYSNYSELRNYPVEFLFSLNQISKILAVPSSSLVFADYSKLTILVPRDKKLFMRRFLDQTIYLDNIGVTYSEI